MNLPQPCRNERVHSTGPSFWSGPIGPTRIGSAVLDIGTVHPERLHSSFTHERKLILDGIPDNLVINPVISVSNRFPIPRKPSQSGPGAICRHPGRDESLPQS